jgi:hypothetical protein
VNNFALELWYDEGIACTFYTVRKLASGKQNDSETDHFFERFTLSGTPYRDQAWQLSHLIIEVIGNRFGATDDFFDRSENLAQALPPKPKSRVEEIRQLGPGFPLRLFCLRITEQIVVLFNGGIKESRTAQESPDLGMKFHDAQVFSRRIIDAIQSGMIRISNDEKYLEFFDGSSEIIL